MLYNMVVEISKNIFRIFVTGKVGRIAKREIVHALKDAAERMERMEEGDI